MNITKQPDQDFYPPPPPPVLVGKCSECGIEVEVLGGELTEPAHQTKPRKWVWFVACPMPHKDQRWIALEAKPKARPWWKFW